MSHVGRELETLQGMQHVLVRELQAERGVQRWEQVPLLRSPEQGGEQRASLKNLSMTTLVYKRTHTGDPAPDTGVFGCHDCMGHVRGWGFDAAIGVGGIGAEAEKNGLNGKLTWIGVGALKTGDREKPLVTFDHFVHYGEAGPSLRSVAPNLAMRMYDRNIRATTDAAFLPDERREIANILDMAKDSGPSQARFLAETSRHTQKQCQRQDRDRTKRFSVQR
jgi:hypothetical protein